MNNVVRQNEPEFLAFLDRMREGKMIQESAQRVKDKCLDKMVPADRDAFNKAALHICPTWNLANKICCKYLNNDLQTPIADLCEGRGTSKAAT